MSNQYDYDIGPVGPLAPLHDRAALPEYPAAISPPIGWLEIVLNLDAELAAILPDYTIFQVKEKGAALRFYIDSYGVGKDDPRIQMAKELIADAEIASMRSCQVCGHPGRYRSDLFWHATLCDKHSG